MDRTPGAVEYRRQLRSELLQLETDVRPDFLTLTELRDLLDIYRPAAQRIATQ